MIDPKKKQQILRYCAGQDRSHLEVRLKLIHLKVYGEDLEAMMTELIQQDFLNEERFARSFVRGKFRMKGWGREKISRELVRHQLSDYVMRKAWEEIDEAEYSQAAESQARKICDQWLGHSISAPQLRKKVYDTLRRKGFEHEVAWDAVEGLDLPEVNL